MNDPALEDILVDNYRPSFDSQASIVETEEELSDEVLSFKY